MKIRQTFVMFFLVVVLATSSLSNSNVFASRVMWANPLSNSTVLASPGVEATPSQIHICYKPCTKTYGVYPCYDDCLSKNFDDGNCEYNGLCCCT
ncbi:hypothetical protein HID58_063422 [Brassica napus]|uniref:Defensin-like domain-containing protein n=2 Tax=Brassica TaxID=3705 RepID=A0ABQ8A487_BRANA|nr:PREDICTED: putative defensin-like protein 55 [Brassica oleracea var. oleracea]XP_022569050.1 putative defensin-like protein 55 [Brassica napus]KAH0887326.1 hypothetical protein HID58_063422 [Brassica napus]